MVSQVEPALPSEGASSSSPSPVSEKKRAANRANAQRSTGPRTEKGKKRSRLNATRHGLRGELPPNELPDEMTPGFSLVDDPNPLEYARLYDAFDADLRPAGAAEQFLVERMARAAWRLRRADAVEVRLLDSSEGQQFVQHLKDKEVAAELLARLSKGQTVEEARLEGIGAGFGDLTEEFPPYVRGTLSSTEAREFRTTGKSDLLCLAQYQLRLEGTFRASLRELRSLRKERAKWNEDADDPWDDDATDPRQGKTGDGQAENAGRPLAVSQTEPFAPTNEPTAAEETSGAPGSAKPQATAAPTNEATEAPAPVAPTNEPNASPAPVTPTNEATEADCAAPLTNEPTETGVVTSPQQTASLAVIAMPSMSRHDRVAQPSRPRDPADAPPSREGKLRRAAASAAPSFRAV